MAARAAAPWLGADGTESGNHWFKEKISAAQLAPAQPGFFFAGALTEKAKFIAGSPAWVSGSRRRSPNHPVQVQYFRDCNRRSIPVPERVG